MADDKNSFFERTSIGSSGSRFGNKDKGTVSNLVKGAVIGVAALTVVLVIVLSIVGMRSGWGDNVKETVRETLDLPAAKVNGTAISYSAFTSDLESARHFFSGAAGAGAEMPDDEELRQGVLDRLIEQVVIEEEAKRFGVEVTQEEIDTEFQKLADAEGGDPAEQINELYGWTIEEFKNKVMRYYVLEGKLAEALANDPELSADVEARANDVLSRLEAGEEFAAVAQEVSDDPGSVTNGGELGSFGRGIMVGPFEEAAFSLEPGETSGLVKTQFGYHIIKVTDSTVGDDGEVEEVEASHILIAFPSIEAYLGEKIAEAEVENLIK
jgi:parvulin-like peptidyl-prolyl isomerase